MQVPPPQSEAELDERARAIAGRQLAELALFLGVAEPGPAQAAKGWAGQLVEAILGATAASRPVPDFELIGVELKTIPIGKRGEPLESTYVSTVPLSGKAELSWENSVVHHKLARVLWVPIETEHALPIPARRIGTPILWSPSRNEEQALRADWEELMDMVCLGQLDQITAHFGTHLQIRPKARDASVRTVGIDADGNRTQTNPRGFYLRTSFTGAILNSN